MSRESTSNKLQAPPMTACLFDIIGSLVSPDISNLQKIFLTGRRLIEGIISLIPMRASESTPGIVYGEMFILLTGN